jgi:hypothetical protein
MHAGKHIGEHPMSYSVKSVSLGVFLWLRQAGNMELYCNEVSTIRFAAVSIHYAVVLLSSASILHPLERPSLASTAVDIAASDNLSLGGVRQCAGV